MQTIATIALNAILSCAQAPAVDVEAERPRLERIARDVATAAIAADGGPFTGEARVEAAALALVAISVHESHLSAEVQDCRKTGDEGRSVTIFQLYRAGGWTEPERSELCSDNELASHEALRILERNGRKAKTVGGLFDAYAGKRGKASIETCAIFEAQAKRAGLTATCRGGRAVAFAKRDAVERRNAR